MHFVLFGLPFAILVVLNLPEVVVEGALQKAVEAVEEAVVAAAAQASVRFLASRSYEKYSQSLCP